MVDEDPEQKPPAPLPPPPPAPVAPAPVVRIVVKHHLLGARSSVHDPNTLVEIVPFSTLGKIQPFLVSMSTNAALVMDFHCHLTTSEVVGYLAGHWDVNAHNLAIMHAMPCRSRLSDKEMAPIVESEIQRAIEQRHLTLVGWYHSHPTAPATPTLRDIDSQLDYEIQMKGNSDASYTPCVGVICSPYNKESSSLESSVVSYWVVPPPENKPFEYGKPMLMSYSVIQDQYLTQDTLNEMKNCADFYKGDQDFVNFNDKYRGDVTYLEKLKATLTPKFPRDQNDGKLWHYLSELVCPGSTGETKPPVISTPPPMSATTTAATNIPPSPLSSATTLPINIPTTPKTTSMLGAEIASALFASGKFPSPASLMGLSAMFPPTSSPSINLLKSMTAPPPPRMMKPEDFSTSSEKNYTVTSGHTP